MGKRKSAPISAIRPGENIIFDLKQKPTFHLNSAYHCVNFYLPRAALRAIAEDANAPSVPELHYKPAVPHVDPVLRGIAEVLLPLFRNPDRVNRLFMDHLMLAVGHHVASKYGGMRLKEQPILGGLTPDQERRAKEMLRENLSGKIPLADVASECGLSPSGFGKAFRNSVGTPPHQWVIRQRITLAKTLLRDGCLPLSEVAMACGFSGLWRRYVRE